MRYVTLGSGQLLSDFEILCSLHSAGLTIESITCVDGIYTDKPAAKQPTAMQQTAKQQTAKQLARAGGGGAASKGDATSGRAAVEEAEEEAKPADAEALAALEQLGAFFHPASVHAFGSVDTGGSHGTCTIPHVHA